MEFKISQLKIQSPQLQPESSAQQPSFDVQAATIYNTKTESYFKNYDDDIKRVLNTTSSWTSPEFAKAVYEWQKNNGLTGKWIDGKFGVVTMGKMAQVDSSVGNKYDPYAIHKQLHANDKPYQRVVSLTQEVERIRNDMGATDIPLPLLMGWIQVESGGKLNNLTTSAGIREAGLFQISDEEARTIGVDQDKVMEDQEYAIRSGIQLIRHHEGNVEQALSKYPNMQQVFKKDNDMYWKLVMFSFSAGPGTMERLIANMNDSNYAPNSWDDVMKFAALNPAGYKHSPMKWSYHVNRAFNLGNQITGQDRQAYSKIHMRIKRAKRKAKLLVILGG
jgi:hypothetical protein